MSIDNPVTIVIACGSGIVTSTTAKIKVEEIAKSIEIPVEVSTCNIKEINRKIGSVDIVLSVGPYKFPEEVKYGMGVFPLITGFNEEACADQLKSWITEISTKKN